MWKGFTSFCSSNYSHDIFNKVYLCVSISNAFQSISRCISRSVSYFRKSSESFIGLLVIYVDRFRDCLVFFFCASKQVSLNAMCLCIEFFFLSFGHKLSSNRISCETIHLNSLKSIEKFGEFPPLYCQWQAFVFEIPTYFTFQSLTELQPAETCIYTKYASENVSICNLFEWEQRLFMKWLVLYIYSWPKMKLREKHK